VREENVQYFTETEEEIIRLLIATGMQKTVAKVLVFVARKPGITSRAIERGADLRQPEVSTAMKYLRSQEWITSHEDQPGKKGRPAIVYGLAKPFMEIMGDIEEEMRTSARDRLDLFRKMRKFVKKEF